MGFVQDILRFHRGEMKVEPDWKALATILAEALRADAPEHEFDHVLRRAVANYYRLDINDAATLHRLRTVKNWLLSQRTVADVHDATAPRRNAERVCAYAAHQCRLSTANER